VKTQDEYEVAKLFMEIYDREGQPEVWVDITSTTKTIIRVVLSFAMLFGFQMYNVAARKSYPNAERTKRILDRLFNPDLQYLEKFRAELEHCIETRNPDKCLRRVRHLLEEQTSEIGYNLKANSPGSRIEKAILPHINPISFKDTDKQILLRLLEFDDSLTSIKKLSERVKMGKPNVIGYRSKKLESWGLIRRTEKGKTTTIELTPIGKGIATTLAAKNLVIQTT
jgi:hypothetical protein